MRERMAQELVFADDGAASPAPLRCDAHGAEPIGYFADLDPSVVGPPDGMASVASHMASNHALGSNGRPATNIRCLRTPPSSNWLTIGQFPNRRLWHDGDDNAGFRWM
jgi:hypothetical protein